MSGSGQRFLDAGYELPKPLIEVDGKAMIEHVIGLFPGETSFVFICNSRDIEKTNLADVLKRALPSGKIVQIPPHKKGPVYAVSKIFDLLKDEEEVIVNYCDFSKSWSYRDFLKKARNLDADGGISAYRGFHPHMLGTTNYAFIRNDGEWLLEIQEKKPFTNNRMREYASDGTYYFKKGKYVKKYCKQIMDEDINLEGEYYVSMLFNLMKKDHLKICIYEIEQMLQWGAPRDLEEYQKWSRYFRQISKPRKIISPRAGSINLIPLAGKGKRFVNEGYKTPKALINVGGLPMVMQAAKSLPCAEKYIFICLKEHLDNFALADTIQQAYPEAKIVTVDSITEGQARTCEIGLYSEDLEASLLIGACDNGMLWDADKYQSLISDENVDVIVWSFRHSLASERNPEMYGWIKTDARNNVLSVSVKVPISDKPYNDQAIVGTFYFKKVSYFLRALKRIYEKNIRVNNEFYVDSCLNELIELGLRVKIFEVDSYICWGTPDDLKTYEYWMKYFRKQGQLSAAGGLVGLAWAGVKNNG